MNETKTSTDTQRYWIETLKGWAEDRLSGPQYDECCAVLDQLTSDSEILQEWANDEGINLDEATAGR